MLLVIFQIAVMMVPPTAQSTRCALSISQFVELNDQQPMLGRLQALHRIFSKSNYTDEEISLFHSALDRMFERGERIPQARFINRFNFSEERRVLVDENRVIGNQWEPLIPHHEPIRTVSTTDITNEITMLRDKKASEGMTIEFTEFLGQPVILRTQFSPSELGAIRKTAAASKLNEMMGLQTVPRARWISLFDRKSLASQFAQGTTPARYNRHHFDPWSVSDVEGFEFLVGQTDGSELNSKECARSSLSIFDHDQAFITSIPTQSDFCIAGAKIPETYSTRFVKALKQLKRSHLISNLGHLLTLDELDFIMLRREILLVDIEKNENEKIIYGP